MNITKITVPKIEVAKKTILLFKNIRFIIAAIKVLVENTIKNAYKFDKSLFV